MNDDLAPTFHNAVLIAGEEAVLVYARGMAATPA
jgi:hypothetical protein